MSARHVGQNPSPNSQEDLRHWIDRHTETSESVGKPANYRFLYALWVAESSVSFKSESNHAEIEIEREFFDSNVHLLMMFESWEFLA